MASSRERRIYICSCVVCMCKPRSKIAQEHHTINRLVALVDEKRRRRFVGFLARERGRGGIEYLSLITGMDPKTIRRGMRDNQASSAAFPRRVRRPGGGRKRSEDETPSLLEALDELLRDATAGDPGSSMKWTKRSTRKLARALRRQGFRIGYRTVARLLHRRQYSLRTNRKCLAGTNHRDRDRQFQYVVRQRRRYLQRGWPIISVDAKKRELVGNFKNPGRCWRREPRQVLDHDYRRNALGVAIIYGIYEIARNVGYVVIGCSHETPGFAVAAIRRWWFQSGCYHYVGVKRLLIEADGGGANSSRTLAWKVALQRLADELQMVICVSHLPPGASKWNLIEHRMFSLNQ